MPTGGAVTKQVQPPPLRVNANDVTRVFARRVQQAVLPPVVITGQRVVPAMSAEQFSMAYKMPLTR